MLTLSHTIVVDPASDIAALGHTYLRFVYKPLAHLPGLEDAPRREVLAETSVEVHQPMNAGSYAVELPIEAIVGPTAASARLFLRFLAAAVVQSDDADVLSLTVGVQARTEEDRLLGSCGTLQAVYFVKGISAPVAYVESSAGRITQARDDSEVLAYLRDNLFLINRSVYSDLRADLRALSGSGDQPHFLLHLLSYHIDLTGDRPRWTDDLSNDDRAAEQDILHRMEFQDFKAAIDRIKARFDELFDFPISTVGLQIQDVAGTFRVRTSDGSMVTLDQVRGYSLSLEYTTLDEDDQPVTETVFYDWSRNLRAVVDNTINFDFTRDIGPVLPATPHAPISVFVKAPDGTILWEAEHRAGGAAIRALAIEVPLIFPATVSAPGAEAAGNKRLRGRVVDLTQKATLKDAMVVIQAKRAGDAGWTTVASGHTDAAGNFSLPYPRGQYVAAQALVSLTPTRVAVPVDKDRGDNAISDDFLYLLLEGAVAPGKPHAAGGEDCGCHGGARTSRLPDHSDLISSDEYSQDLGTGCISLSTPNRTLSEYANQALVRTSDPDVANYRLARDEGGRFTLIGDSKKIKRRAVDLTNPIRWQDAADGRSELSFYQAVTVATGHILHYKSVFKADGYSLGDLLYSLPLAPGQKKQIVIFDSKHSLEGAESQQLSVSERLAAGIVNDRSVLDQLTGRIGEGLRGDSRANTAGVSVGLGVAANAGFASGSLGIAGGYSNSESSASQDSSRDVSQFFQEKLRNSVMQNADSYRQQNASVVTTVTQGQQYSASTEVVSNHNHCHALTMMYFEVLRHYAVFQELTHVEECVFVPLLMTDFTIDNIYKWQDVLAPNLLPISANTYLQKIGGDHPLLRAFDAIDRKKTNYEHVDFPQGSHDQEPIRFIKGSAVLRVELPRPQTRYDRIKSLPVITKTVTREEFDPEGALKKAGLPTSPGDVLKSIFTLGISTMVDSANASTTRTVSEDVLARARVFDTFMQLDDNYESVPPAQCMRITNFQLQDVVFWGRTLKLSGLDFFGTDTLDRQQWTAYAELLGVPVLQMLETYFKGRLIAEWDDIFYKELAPALFEKLVESLNITGMDADFSSTRRYHGGEQHITVNVSTTTSHTRRSLGESLKLFSEQSGLHAVTTLATLGVETLTLTYSTSYHTGMLFSGHLGDDIADGVLIDAPLTPEDQRDPRKEDTYLAGKLIEHLNSNLEYYNKVLWTSLDPDRRYMLLDGFNIQIFNGRGVPIGLKSLASVVKNELITVVGNALVLPVAAGFKVDRSYIVERTDVGGVEKIDLIDHYRPRKPTPPFRISVPTRGVFAEAVMGQCDACENVKERSSQDWDKFRTDEPTSFSAVTPPAAVASDWKAAFKDLAAPLVAMQAAPAAPGVGAGLANLSELLGKGDAFRDVTGLAKNQENAMATYQSNQESARAFAEMAKSMAMQSHNTEHADKIMDSIKAAKASGALNDEEYGKAVKKHIDHLIDGGEASKLATEKKNAPKQTISDAAVKAVQEGKDVKAEERDDKGNVKSVRVRADKPGAATPAAKVYNKTLYFRAVDCYGDLMNAWFAVNVEDTATRKNISTVEFEARGSTRVPFPIPRPTVVVSVFAEAQPGATTPIVHAIEQVSDPFTLPEGQGTISAVLRQTGYKKTIQTKESKLTAEKILDELSKKGSVEVAGKGKLLFEINSKIAGELASKHVTEVSVSTGADEMNTFEVLVPTNHYELSLK